MPQLRTKRPETETRLTYRLRKLTADQRSQLLQELNMGRTTFFDRLRNPMCLTLEEASTICRFLEALDGCDYDLFEELKPVI